MLPQKIKIGAHLISVLVVSPENMSGDAVSEFSPVLNQIRVRNDLSETQIESAFLHEIFHALNYTYGTNDNEHAIIEFWAQGLYQVLKENKLKF